MRLKLTIYRITLKTKGGNNLTDQQKFGDFYKAVYNKETKRDNYLSFVKEFFESFNEQFYLNNDGSKCIGLQNVSDLSVRSETNIIDGSLLGGGTGMPSSIFNQFNINYRKSKLNTDDVSVVPFYMSLWTPYDMSTGFLMVQSYSGYNIDHVLKVKLQKFYSDRKYSLIITPFLPKTIKDRYKENSYVYKIAVVRDEIPKEKRSLHIPLFAKFENLKARVEYSGFRVSVNELWDSLSDNKKMLQPNLFDEDLKEEDKYELIAYYKDEDGNQTHTSIKKNFDINPTLWLPNTIKQKDSPIFKLDDIRKHVDGILQKCKKEIGYNYDSKD